MTNRCIHCMILIQTSVTRWFWPSKFQILAIKRRNMSNPPEPIFDVLLKWLVQRILNPQRSMAANYRFKHKKLPIWAIYTIFWPQKDRKWSLFLWKPIHIFPFKNFCQNWRSKMHYFMWSSQLKYCIVFWKFILRIKTSHLWALFTFWRATRWSQRVKNNSFDQFFTFRWPKEVWSAWKRY